MLLGRLLTNLLDNAQRHAATAVTVAVRAEDDESLARRAKAATAFHARHTCRQGFLDEGRSSSNA
ncbi:hypothetical protein AB0C27_22080 [Nonomuraea sp. NPDC048882]|uniref:hypothetical protein n=1 Tax=unclassified Nonomuraea TaxID=2593643 RepID=UPI000AC15DA8